MLFHFCEASCSLGPARRSFQTLHLFNHNPLSLLTLTPLALKTLRGGMTEKLQLHVRPCYVQDSFSCSGEGSKRCVRSVDGPKQPWGTAVLRSLLSSPLTAWCSPFTVYWEEVECAGGWGGALQRFMKDFHTFFLFQNLKFVPERDQCSSPVLTGGDVKGYCESHESVVKIKPEEPKRRLEPVRYWVCRWTFTECLQSRRNFPH